MWWRGERNPKNKFIICTCLKWKRNERFKKINTDLKIRNVKHNRKINPNNKIKRMRFFCILLLLRKIKKGCDAYSKRDDFNKKCILLIIFSLFSVPPLSLLLQGLNHALVAGTRTHVTCTAVGARPPPQILWSKGGQLIKGATYSVSYKNVKSNFRIFFNSILFFRLLTMAIPPSLIWFWYQCPKIMSDRCNARYL